MIYESERGMEMVQALADKWETTSAEVIRRLIREKAAEEGISIPESVLPPDDEPKA